MHAPMRKATCALLRFTFGIESSPERCTSCGSACGSAWKCEVQGGATPAFLTTCYISGINNATLAAWFRARADRSYSLWQHAALQLEFHIKSGQLNPILTGRYLYTAE